ncbi:hypothetical protein Gpo141_00000864 [Globisporangium polare]
MAPYQDDFSSDGGDRYEEEEEAEDGRDDLDGEDINLDNLDENNTKPPILTSPRSIEACRMLGVEPEELVKRPVEYFFTRSIHSSPSALNTRDDPALAEKRAVRYEKHRQIQLRNARAQRYELLDAGLNGVHGAMSLRTRSFCRSPIGAKLSVSKHDASSRAAHCEFTTIEREKKELERMQQRQVAEMQQMLTFELKMAEIHQERDRKEQQKKRQEEQIARERTRRQREADEMKRRRELEKVEQHKIELEFARREAQEKQTEAIRKEQRDKKEEERRRRDALLSEKERQRKQEEARLQSELYQLAQAREFAKKEQEIARRDERRRQQLDYKKRLKVLEVTEKQQRNKMRITSVLQDKEVLKTMQLQEAERKQQLGEERRRQFEEERRQKEEDLRYQAQRKKETIDMVQQQLHFREQQRRERLVRQEREAECRLQMKELEKQTEREHQKREEQRQEDERRRAYERMEQQLRQKQETYLSKAEEKSMITRTMLDQKRQSVRSRLQEAKLREEEIQAALTRKQKQDSYKADLLMSRIESDNQRARMLKEQRQSLIRRRQQIKQSASRQKQEILDSFYKMKVTKKFELPKHLAASLMARPQSASVLQTRSLTDDSFADNRKHNSKRPASAIGRPRSASMWRGGAGKSLQQRSYSEAIDDENSDTREPRSDEQTSNNGKLEEVILQAEIDALRRKHNEELLQVLEEEHHAEEQREYLLRQARDPSEKSRMESIFAKERARASERIMRITQKHEQALASRIDQLQGG